MFTSDNFTLEYWFADRPQVADLPKGSFTLEWTCRMHNFYSETGNIISRAVNEIPQSRLLFLLLTLYNYEKKKKCNMTKSKLFETSKKDLETINSNNNIREFTAQNFYNPLCVTGYLTPLQRKKLREKRNISQDLNLSSLKKVKKVSAPKRKIENLPSARDRSKDRIKRIKTKDIQGVQCTVSKILRTKPDNNTRTKKFFKSSSSDRLAKANFSMHLDLKKNVFSGIDKCVKESISHTRKLNMFKENVTYDSHSIVFDNSEISENISSLHSENKNLNENSNSPKKPFIHIIKHEDFKQISLPDEEDTTFKFDWPSDDELLRRQQKARLLSRKRNILKEVNIHHEHKEIEKNEQNFEGKEMKFYPIFHAALKKQLQCDNIKSNQKNVNKKIKGPSKGSSEQMIIDAGQKEIGAKICATCNMLYSIGHEEDEKLHLNYHNMYLINLKFLGWKEENVIGEYSDGRVIMIRKADKSFMLKKVEDVLQVANRDLGFPSSAVPAVSDLTFLLFISKNKQVAGCIVAEPIAKAFRVLLADNSSTPMDSSEKKVWRIGNWYSSSEAVPAVCGVNRIWVAHSYRRQKVASRMMDCLRCHFIHGHVIGIRELAFTDPSPDGREFAAAYTGTDCFLVYK